MGLKLVGFCEGAAVYVAEHVITLREHGGSIDMELAKSIRKYEKNAGAKPAVILTADQLALAETQGIEAFERYERAASKADALGKPLPDPDPEPALSLATPEEKASADEELEPSSE